MDKSFLPQAYVEKFSLSPLSVPPLSAFGLKHSKLI
jgi:hypothetical protein